MRDRELLAAYLRNGSESAFAELVNRHISLAYSVAQRKLGDHSLSEEVVQMVFCLLLRKAHTLTGYENLAGWIHRAAYNLSLKTFRDERRRHDRERALANMHDSTLPQTSEQPWEHLAPLLDEALQQLSDSDRGVLVLRFVQQKAMREVGETLGTTEAAAKMRVGRALEKVRNYFVRRGVSCSTAGLAAALATLSGEAVPVGLAASVAASALASAGASAGAGWLLLKTLILMTQLKTTLVLVGLGTVAVLMMGNYVAERSLKSRPAQSGGEAPGRAAGVSTPPSRGKPNGLFAFSDQMAAKLREAGLERAAAKLKAALEAPPRKGTRSYPSEAILKAVEAFGAYQDQAFPILKEAAEGDNLEARQQAIAALGMIGKQVPEARPLLWKLLEAGEERDRFSALSALGNIGIRPEEMATLTAMIPGQTNPLLVRYLPEAIARAIQQNPEAVKPYLGSVEALLQHADPAVRFSAACALAEAQGGQKPEILKEVAAGLAVSKNTQYPLGYQLTAEDHWRHNADLMAVETLQRVGPAAKAVLPELQAFAEAAPNELMREQALRAIAAIDNEASVTQPEVRAVVTQDQQRNALRERLQTGTFTTEDLSQGLKEPFTTALAISRLAELGSAAKSALPELHQALAGKDEATRDEIMAAIKQIDPDYQVERISQKPVLHGALAAQLELEIQRGDLSEATAASLEKLILKFRMGNTSWYTRSEVAEFSEHLKAANPRIWNIFVAKASEMDPNFQSALARTHP